MSLVYGAVVALAACWIYGFASGWIVRGWIRNRVIVGRQAAVPARRTTPAVPPVTQHTAPVMPSRLSQVVVLDGKGTRH